MVRVVERKLGRERAVGQAHTDEKLIEIDPRQKPYDWGDTLTHEAMHVAYPDMSEDEIARGSRIVWRTLWRAGVRRVHVK